MQGSWKNGKGVRKTQRQLIKTIRVPACSQILLFCVLCVHACLNVYVYARHQPERQASGASHLGLFETEFLTGPELTS